MGLEGYNVWIPPTDEQRRQVLSEARDRLFRAEATDLDRDLIRAEHRLLDLVQVAMKQHTIPTPTTGREQETTPQTRDGKDGEG